MNKVINTNFTKSDLSLSSYEVFSKVEKELQLYFDWNDETLTSYKNTMQKLQKFFVLNKSFEDLEFIDYENAIENQGKNYLNTHTRGYSKSTISKQRNIIMRLCEYIDILDIGYTDTCWGCYWKHRRETYKKTDKTLSKRKEQLAKERKEEISDIVSLPKSLTILAENKLASTLRDASKDASGEAIGGLLMLYLGLRPGEVCALKYSNIKPIKNTSDYNILYVIEQFDTKNKLKSALKTQNAYRALPIPLELMEIISARKDWIKSQLPNTNIDEFPMVNDKNNFNQICKRKAFSNYITNIFRAIELEEDIITYSNNLLYKEKSVKEADATTYILRRNFATIMSSVCMMNEDELQYLMGHDIKNGNKRYSYLAPEILIGLTEKMNKRHLLKRFENNTTIINNDDFYFDGINDITLVANSDTFNDTNKNIFIDIYSDHCDTLTISARKNLYDTTGDNKPLLEFNNDYKKTSSSNMSRINISHKYYRAMITSFNRSQGHKKKKT